MKPAAPYVASVTTPTIGTLEGEVEGLFTSIFNLTGVPAIVLPCGFNDVELYRLVCSSPHRAGATWRFFLPPQILKDCSSFSDGSQ